MLSILKDKKLFLILSVSTLVLLVLILFGLSLPGPLSAVRILLAGLYVSISIFLFYINGEAANKLIVILIFLLPVYQSVFIFGFFFESEIYKYLPIFGFFVYFFKRINHISKKSLFLFLVISCISLCSYLFSEYSDNLFLLKYFTAILLPFLFYWSADANEEVDVYISVSVLLLCLCSLIFLSLEINYKDKGSTLGLQSGNLYMVVGVLLLSFPILLSTFTRTAIRKLIFVSLFLLVIIMSYSRGAILFTFPLAVFLLVSCLNLKEIKTNFLILFFLVALSFYYQDFFTKLIWQWGLKFNIVSNSDDYTVLSIDNSLNSGRGELWTLVASHITESIEKIFLGIGIGNFQNFSQINSEFSFSSAHNIVLTTLIERGLIITCAVLFFFFVLIRRLFLMSWNSRKDKYAVIYSFFAFILFALTTGVELFQQTYILSHATISIILIYLYKRYSL